MTVATKAERRSRVKITRTIQKEPHQQEATQVQREKQDRIAAKAYALYEQHGRREGHALEDWLEAEYLVNQELYETH